MSHISKYQGILLTPLKELKPGQLYQIKTDLYAEYGHPGDSFPTLSFGRKIIMVGEDLEKWKELIFITSKSGISWKFLDECGKEWWDFEDKLKWKLIEI